MARSCPSPFLWALSSQCGAPAPSTELHLQLRSKHRLWVRRGFCFMEPQEAGGQSQSVLSGERRATRTPMWRNRVVHHEDTAHEWCGCVRGRGSSPGLTAQVATSWPLAPAAWDSHSLPCGRRYRLLGSSFWASVGCVPTTEAPAAALKPPCHMRISAGAQGQIKALRPPLHGERGQGRELNSALRGVPRGG